MAVKVVLSSESKTQDLAKSISAHIEAGDVILLNGPLGAGKTTFVKALSKELGVSEAEVVSSTFIIAQKYQGTELGIYHLDLYRIDLHQDNINELDSLLREVPDSDSILLAEWGSKLDDKTFVQCLSINFDYADSGRTAELVFKGASWKKRSSAIEKSLN